MPNLMKPGRIVLTATLAASTMLGNLPVAMAAGSGTLLLAQADPDAPPLPPRQGRQRPGEEQKPGGEGRPQGENRPERPERPKRQEAEPDGGGAEAQPQQRQKRAAPPEPAAAEPRPEAPAARRPAPEGEPEPQNGRRPPQPAEEGQRPAERPAPAPKAAQPETAQPEAPPPRRERRQPAEVQPQDEAAPAPAEPTDNRRQRQGGEPERPAPAGSERAPENEAAPARPRPGAPAAVPGNDAEKAPAAGTRRPNPAEVPNANPREQPAEPTTAPAPGAAPAGRPAPATPDAGAPRETAPAAPGSSQIPARPPRPPRGEAEPNATPRPAAPDANTIVPPAPQAPPPAAPAAPAPAPGTPITPPLPPAALPGNGAQPAPTPPAQGAASQPVIQPPPPQDLRPRPVPADIQNAPVQPGRINQSDARVQTLQQPIDVRPITQETGERIREDPRYVLPPDAKVVKRDGDRQILSLGAAAVAGAVAGAAAGYFIRSNDDDRIAVDSNETYSERLPGGRTRDTIVRANGVQIVTITNKYGDVIRRSRVMPDGREVVLFYDPYGADAQRPDYYEDPGQDLPPLRLDIPEDRYIVDVDRPDERLYYDTLVAPPVETVERIYSVDEVRRSERIRDKVRRIDLATINFDFASAAISQDQARKLQDLADAIKKIVDSDPGETFLIEGHTDAVGSPEANLILSDKRAESVASALTQYFDVPAENLVTQGYGEQELKVNTQAENRENRRVTVRRITALVKPVATSSR